MVAAADGEELAHGEAGMGSCQALPAAEAVGVNKKGPVWGWARARSCSQLLLLTSDLRTLQMLLGPGCERRAQDFVQ